jgi:Putative metallopeptidase
MHQAVVVIAAIVAMSLPGAATARATRAPSGQIDIAYGQPTDHRHQPLYEFLRSNHALERLQTILSPFRLPRRLVMKVEHCNGEPDAWYEEGAVTVCYEYLDEVRQSAPEETGPSGVSRVDAIVGPLMDVFLHEFSHALFDLLAVPVLGREEDAADQVAAFMMLQFQKEEARRLILGTAHIYRTWVLQAHEVVPIKAFSDVHGTPAQRFYNLLCIAYGADPALFRGMVEQEHLPKERAEGCAYEYRQVAYAFRRLIGPHVDRARARKVLSARWLPEVSTRPQRRPRAPHLR